jgi:hypothetical protein
MNVIFNRPVRIGKVVYPKSKRSVAIDDKLMEGNFIQQLIKDGDIIVPAVAKPAPAAAKVKE